MINYMLGDALTVLPTLPENHFHSLVTDPPASIAFMNNEWDKDKGGRQQWCAWLTAIMKEAYRTLRPGAHALVWAYPRRCHWTMIALEDAGFEIREVIHHIHGHGFPKGLNVAKGIDKKLRKERDKYDPITEQAKQWDGWNTTLRPSIEYWILCRKPLGEKTIVDNVLKWGTGAINIDDCRVNSGPSPSVVRRGAWGCRRSGGVYGNGVGFEESAESFKTPRPAEQLGRFAANLIHDGSLEAMEWFAQYGASKSTKHMYPKPFGGEPESHEGYKRPSGANYKARVAGYNDEGTASRFFYQLEGTYCAKASKAERGTTNRHPCVKPLTLMEYLITLITPEGGSVLDCFGGSGSTAVAAQNLNKDCTLIEMNEEYMEIAKKRCEENLCLKSFSTKDKINS